MKEKMCWIDVETTGTDPVKNGIHQIAGIIEVDGQVVQTFDYKVRPFDADEVTPQAVTVSGKTVEEIMQYPLPGDVYRTLIGTLSVYVDKYNKRDKFFLVGFNSPFDSDFLRNWFAKNSDNYFGSFFWWPDIDVARLTCHHLQADRHRLPNFKLQTVAAHFGLADGVDWHDAMADIRVTRELYRVACCAPLTGDVQGPK